jgi:hypothetical protein
MNAVGITHIDIDSVVFVHFAVQKGFEELHVFVFVLKEVLDPTKEFCLPLTGFEQEAY